MSTFTNYLMKEFQMKDLQGVKLFLGIRIMRTENTVSLDQSYYLKTVLNKYMCECKSVNTPLENKLNYEELNMDQNLNVPCRNLIGCLMYAMLCKRPDLCVAISILSRFQSKSNKTLWICLKKSIKIFEGIYRS